MNHFLCNVREIYNINTVTCIHAESTSIHHIIIFNQECNFRTVCIVNKPKLCSRLKKNINEL